MVPTIHPEICVGHESFDGADKEECTICVAGGTTSGIRAIETATDGGANHDGT